MGKETYLDYNEVTTYRNVLIMATKSNNKMDRAGEFIANFRAKHQNTRKFWTLTLQKYKNLELIITQVGDKHDIRLFRDGADEVLSYWLEAKERRPIVVDMLKAGMKQTVIAKMLKFHPGTIHNDVRWLRDNTDLLDNVTTLRPRRPKLRIVGGRMQRTSTYAPTGVALQ